MAGNLKDFANIPVIREPEESFSETMKEFMKTQYNVEINDYWDLHKWSIENISEFWSEVWRKSGIICSEPYNKVIDLNVPMHEPQNWFAGAKLNYAENVLRFRDDHVALIVAGEDRETEKVTYAEMYEEVKLYVAALRKMGIKKGDRVACFMSNRKEAILAMFGATSIGAIWMGALPLMGSQAVLNRFKNAQPKVLFSVDRFPHDRQEIEMLSKVKEIAEGLPSLEKVIIVPSKPESKLKDISKIRNGCFLDDFLETGKNSDGTVPDIIFEQVSFTHPVFISYTSGTTGPSKALIHGCGAVLLMYRDFGLRKTYHRNACWLTTSPPGWATWNMFATMLMGGTSMVVYEGVPFFLSPTSLWDMVDELQINCMMLAPSVLDELEKKGYTPTEKNHLRSLFVLLATSSVVKPQNYDFAYKKIKKNMIFSSAYGSTEVMGCTSLVPSLRIYKGELTAPSLATDISCVDNAGNPVIGEIGEFVINKPTPSLPLGLWGDDDRSIFRKTYFEKFPGKFTTGDLAMINPVTRGLIIYGRSDDTLKPKGWRFGSSEIYSIVDAFPEVFSSLCVSQYNKDRDERVVLFLKMNSGHCFNEDLVKRIREAITRELSIHHVPEVILEAKEIPVNMNGKRMEIVVKKIINHMAFNPETVINPECLKNFKDIPELQGF